MRQLRLWPVLVAGARRGVRRAPRTPAGAGSAVRRGRRARRGRRGTAGTTGAAGTTGTSGHRRALSGPTGTAGTTGAAASPRARPILRAASAITEIDVGATYAYNEVDNNGPNLGLTPLAILARAGRRLAPRVPGQDRRHGPRRHARRDDQPAGASFGAPGYDVQDIYADAAGGVLLISRPALGSTATTTAATSTTSAA